MDYEKIREKYGKKDYKMTFTLKELNRMMERNGGWLYLSDCTSLTSLPDNLTVGGSLNLGGCTSLTSLPEGLTVGSSLYLSGTKINPSERKKVKELHDGDYVPGKYLYADGILTHIKRRKQMQGYTYYVGKIKNRNVIFDGTNYAHCESFSEGVEDLIFKAAKDRGSDQYKGMSLDTEVTLSEAKTMYRIITGACRQGTNSFVESQENLKEKYTIRELIEITKGQYRASIFEDFFRLEG